MLKSKKNVFWEALVITIAVFLIGLFIGILVENSRFNEINSLYTKSEINLVDGMALLRLSEDSLISCSVLKKENINFADRVYEEAKLLENYEASGKLTNNLKELHKKYDLLRTILWMSNQDSLERCEKYNLIVYLYEYETEDNLKKAKQNVWSKILLEVKEKHEEDILLLPIAADQDLTTLNILTSRYGVYQYPAVIINNERALYELDNSLEIEENLF